MTDTDDKRGETGGGRIRPFAELVSSLRFLTRLPIPFGRTMEFVPLAQSMRMFAISGALIGVVTWVVYFSLLFAGVPIMVAASITFAATLLVTGALHEDGLADVSDGFGGGRDREHRLDIMRDSRIGSYGTLALISLAAVKITSLASLAGMPILHLLALIAAPAAFSRALMVDLMWATKPARQDGLSVMVGRPSRDIAIFNIVLSGVALVVVGFVTPQPASGLIALAVALAVTAIARRVAMKLIGGQTGDVCGAVQTTSEAAMLVVFAASIH